jgi:Tfp pilus assembly protein PilN
MPADSSSKKSIAQSPLHHDRQGKEEPSKPVTINLSGKPKESNSTVFYKWTVQIGRIVIVLTELIALSALFYRFIIDRQIADLNDQIDTQIIFIRSQEQKEQQFRALQDKLTMIKTVKEDTDAKIMVMNLVLDATNNGVFTANNIAVNKNIISVGGVTSSIFSLNNFTDSLEKNDFVTSISIDEITSTDTGILFKLNISLTEASEETDTATISPTEEEL